MAIYKDPREVRKVSIPSIPNSEVELYNTLLWGDLEKIYSSNESDIVKGKKVLIALIKDWNLTDEKGVKLPINEKTINSFTPDVVNYLFSQTDFSDLSKKKQI